MDGTTLLSNVDRRLVLDRLHKLDPFHTLPAQDDIAAGQIFAAVFKEIAKYNTTAKCWYIYDGVRWVADEGGVMVEGLAMTLCRALLIYVADIQSQFYVDFITDLQTRAARERMIKDARAFVSCETTDFDADPDLFNCQNIVLNLKTHRLMEHSPELMLSKVSNVKYDRDAQCDDFKKFLAEIMLGDNEKVEYLQTLFGYALTGRSEREECYFLYGATTRNGKGTLTNLIKYLMGDYAANIQPESLAMQKKDGRSASGDIARLNGVRFLQMSEPPKKMKLDVAMLKTLTGRDAITARNLYEREFEFVPVFKLFVNTNYLPVVLDDTLFSSGRVKVITFDRHFSEAEQDKGLKDRLQAPEALSGVLNWMLEGLKRYHADGNTIEAPEAVKSATAAYRSNSDKIQNFIDEALDADDNQTVSAKDVYAAFVKWCAQNGYGADNKRNFLAELKSRGMLAATGTVNGRTIHNVIKGHKVAFDYLSFDVVSTGKSWDDTINFD